MDSSVGEESLALLEWTLDQQGIHTAIIRRGGWEAFVENGFVPLVLGETGEDGVTFGTSGSQNVASFVSALVAKLRS